MMTEMKMVTATMMATKTLKEIAMETLMLMET